MMKIERITDDIHVAVGDVYESNSTIFLAGRDALLVDGMGSAHDVDALRRYVEGDLGARVRFIISTHYFSDHMAALSRFSGATVVAHELYAHTFATERFRSAEEAAFYVEPSMTFSDRLTLRWGAHTLELFHNPGHTMSTIGIDVADADLLFAGDTAVGNIGYIAYSTPELLAAAVERLRRRNRSTIISSHGGPRDAAALDHVAGYLDALRSRREIDLDALSDFERIFHGRNLEELIARQ
jgi:glyoxylase-like metal-dependent hydrolase (beta-lactamase superfamily II)